MVMDKGAESVILPGTNFKIRATVSHQSVFYL